jgi:peptidoglycan/LPS O-acetylase OafA/YrhL
LPNAARVLPQKTAAAVLVNLSPAEWPWYLTFCSNVLIALRDKYTNGLLDASWSLAIEEHFYLVWPTVVFATTTSARLKSVCIGIIIAALALRTAVWGMGWSRLQIYVVTFTRMDALAFGALIALQLKSAGTAWSGRLQRARRWAATLAVTLLLLWVTGQLAYSATIMNTIAYTLIGLLCMLVITLAIPSGTPGLVVRVFMNRVLRFLGKYSYALYMFQLPVRGVLTLLFFTEMRMTSSPYLSQALLYVAATGATVVAAVASWHLLEKHMLALKDRFTYATELAAP